MTRVLIVDADPQAAELLATLLRLSDPSIIAAPAHTVDAALMFAGELQPDVAIIELGSQAISGEAIAGGILAACPGRRPLLIGLCEQHSMVAEPDRRGIFDHALTKPPELVRLLMLIAKLPGHATA